MYYHFDNFTPPTIYAPRGSCAERYAKKHDLGFKTLKNGLPPEDGPEIVVPIDG